MKPELRRKLAKVAPSIRFKVEWEVDPYFKWDGDGPDPRNSGSFPHDVTVSATAIINGEEITGKDCLGGCYDKPGELCPDVHGYLLDMLGGALADLKEKQSNKQSGLRDPSAIRLCSLIKFQIKDALSLIEQLQKEN